MEYGQRVSFVEHVRDSTTSCEILPPPGRFYHVVDETVLTRRVWLRDPIDLVWAVSLSHASGLKQGMGHVWVSEHHIRRKHMLSTKLGKSRSNTRTTLGTEPCLRRQALSDADISLARRSSLQVHTKPRLANDP